MKLVCIVGSPRKNGNNDILVQELIKGATAEGAETRVFYANDVQVQGCQGCFACKEEGSCAFDDDMTAIYEAITEADAVVFTSPVYMWGITGQLKIILDRLCAFLNPDLSSRLPKGKKLGLIFTQGNPNADMFTPQYEALEGILKMVGFSVVEEKLVAVGMMAPGIVSKNTALLEAARSLGHRLVK